jgi:sulfotransferase
MKTYYFISGLPRSGSTLLSAILRQNPEFYADIASPVNCLIENIIDTLTFSENNLNLDENRRKDIIYGVFDGYYKNEEKSIIFDSSRLWTKKTSLLKELFPYTKILCPVRDIVSILNSFELITSKNPFYSKTITENSDNVFARCDGMMDKTGGVVSSSWVCLQEGYSLNPEMIMFIEYENLCRYPEKTLKQIYNFLEKPYFEHDFDNVIYKNEIYDRSCNLKDLHTVKKKVEYKQQKNILPLEIVEKFKKMNMEFWRGDYKPNIGIMDNLDKKFIEYK